MSLAAILIDYQNMHHFLRGRLQEDASPVDGVMHLLLKLRDQLEDEGLQIVRGYAFADYGGLDDHTRHVQRSLYLHGVEPVYVPGTKHRNTSDLQLAIQAMELRERHPEIETVLLVGGDRDYVPVAKALVARGLEVIHVGFQEHLTPYLLDHTAGGRFLDAAELLPEGSVLADDEIGAPVEVTDFEEISAIPHDVAYQALEVTEEFFGQYDEIYLTPLLRRLSDEIGEVGNHDPKTLVADLEKCGAARLERRRGMPYDYTVLLLNDDHPDVQEARASLSENGYENTGYASDKEADGRNAFDTRGDGVDDEAPVYEA